MPFRVLAVLRYWKPSYDDIGFLANGSKCMKKCDHFQSFLQQNPRLRANNIRTETPALLKGLLYGPDGAAFSPTHTRKGDRLYRYYVSQTVLKHGAGSCSIPRVPAAEIEAAVISQIRAMLRALVVFMSTWLAAQPECEGFAEDEVREALAALDPLWAENSILHRLQTFSRNAGSWE